MQITRLVVLTLFAALGLTGGPLLAQAAHASAPVPDGPYTWSIPAGVCGLPLGVSGTNTYYNVFTNNTFDSVSVGTAMDTSGAVYTFSYHFHASIAAAPTGQFTYVSLDTFNLDGNGADSGYHVRVAYMIQGTNINDESTWTFKLLNVRGGGGACDPI